MQFCDPQNYATFVISLSPFLTTGYHEMQDTLADTFTLLTVIRTSFCCLQEAQCYPNDTHRVQQEIILPETNMILLPE